MKTRVIKCSHEAPEPQRRGLRKAAAAVQGLTCIYRKEFRAATPCRADDDRASGGVRQTEAEQYEAQGSA